MIEVRERGKRSVGLFSLISIAERESVGRGSSMQLVEEANLNEPFRVPTDGYSCENLRGIPQQVLDFLEPMHRAGLCRLYTNVYSLGLWTEFLQSSKMKNSNRIETIVLNKKKNNTLGLNIVFIEVRKRRKSSREICDIFPAFVESISTDSRYLY